MGTAAVSDGESLVCGFDDSVKVGSLGSALCDFNADDTALCELVELSRSSFARSIADFMRSIIILFQC